MPSPRKSLRSFLLELSLGINVRIVGVTKSTIGKPTNPKQKFDQNTISTMCILRKHGHTLPEIARRFGTSKSAIHYHVKNVKIGIEGRLRLEKLMKEIVERARTFSARKRRENARLKLKDGCRKMSSEKASIVAHSLFDGCIGKREVRYFNKNRVLIQEFIDDMKAVYGLEPNSQTIKNGVTTIEFYNLALTEDLLSYTPSYSTNDSRAKVPTAIITSRGSVIREFLRAFWDDEGTVGFYPRAGRFYLRGRCKSESIRRDLVKLHRKLGIKVKEENGGVIIQNDLHSFKKFLKKVGFTPGVKVCEGNQVYPPRWEGYEKNHLLKDIIEYLHSHRRAKNSKINIKLGPRARMQELPCREAQLG